MLDQKYSLDSDPICSAVMNMSSIILHDSLGESLTGISDSTRWEIERVDSLLPIKRQVFISWDETRRITNGFPVFFPWFVSMT